LAALEDEEEEPFSGDIVGVPLAVLYPGREGRGGESGIMEAKMEDMDFAVAVIFGTGTVGLFGAGGFEGREELDEEGVSAGAGFLTFIVVVVAVVGFAGGEGDGDVDAGFAVVGAVPKAEAAGGGVSLDALVGLGPSDAVEEADDGLKGGSPNEGAEGFVPLDAEEDAVGGCVGSFVADVGNWKTNPVVLPLAAGAVFVAEGVINAENAGSVVLVVPVVVAKGKEKPPVTGGAGGLNVKPPVGNDGRDFGSRVGPVVSLRAGA